MCYKTAPPVSPASSPPSFVAPEGAALGGRLNAGGSLGGAAPGDPATLAEKGGGASAFSPPPLGSRRVQSRTRDGPSFPAMSAADPGPPGRRHGSSPELQRRGRAEELLRTEGRYLEQLEGVATVRRGRPAGGRRSGGARLRRLLRVPGRPWVRREGSVRGASGKRGGTWQDPPDPSRKEKGRGSGPGLGASLLWSSPVMESALLKKKEKKGISRPKGASG